MTFMRRIKGVILILMLAIVLYVIIFGRKMLHTKQTSRVTESDRNTTSVHLNPTSFQADDTFSTKAQCLQITPPVRKDEFSPATDNKRVDRVCAGDFDSKTAWRVNFNVERRFRFYQTDDAYKTNKDKFPVERGRSVRIHPKDLREDKRNATIPKILHFVYKDEFIPQDFIDNLKRFRLKHPDWKINFWTFNAARYFIEKHEPQILKKFDQMDFVFQMDVVRYVLIYHIGGAYFDLDMRIIKPLDEIIESYDCVFGPEPIENAVTIVGVESLLANSGFLCRRRHAFLRHVIDFIPLHGQAKPGTKFLTQCFNIFLDKQLSNNTALNENFEISIVPHDFFEYHVIKGYGVDERMKKLCERYKTQVLKYLSKCRMLDTKRSTDNHITDTSADNDIASDIKRSDECETLQDAMYQQIPRGRKIEFDACVEWMSRSEEHRHQSANQFTEHIYNLTHRNHVDLKRTNMSNTISDFYYIFEGR